MDLAMSVAIYMFIWWIVLFAVLPFGVRTQDEDGSVVPGTPGSAPTRPRLLAHLPHQHGRRVDHLRGRLRRDRLQAHHAGDDSVSVTRVAKRKEQGLETLLLRASAMLWSFTAT